MRVISERRGFLCGCSGDWGRPAASPVYPLGVDRALIGIASTFSVLGVFQLLVLITLKLFGSREKKKKFNLPSVLISLR